MTPEELDEKEAEELATAEIEDDDLEEDADAEEDEDEEDGALPDDDEEDDQASLEELLAQRAAGRKAAEESDEDEDDIMALASEPDEPPLIDLPTKVAPIREQKEFVCKSCYLVKPRVQLADAKREYCRDCV